MTFNTAVSGIRAANSYLGVVGNNIANASTTGFKSSRAEFADVYATSGSGGSNSAGSGVIMSNISQQFTQGNIAFTSNNLDLAISGEGFFMLNANGVTEYTRAGAFGVDQDGFVVSAQGSRLQGFEANASGTLSGNVSDLMISTENLAPAQTTNVATQLNLNAQDAEPAERGIQAQTLGADIGDVQAGLDNGYASETVTVTLSDSTTRTITTSANASAAEIASGLGAFPDFTASATSEATVSNIVDNGALEVSLNGVTLVTSAGVGDITAQDIAVAINNLTNTTLRGITAIQNPGNTALTITSTTGENLSISISNSGDDTDSLTVEGTTPNTLVLQGANGNGNGLVATVGGTVTASMEEGISIVSDGGGAALFEANIAVAPFVNNSFNPGDQETYNNSTSVSIYDSLGNSHVLTMFYVKEAAPNTWTMYAQIDGEDVGDPNPALNPPLNEEPTQAAFTLVFDNDGTLIESASDETQITYWNPINEEGDSNGALNGISVANGATFPLSEPYTSSNFLIDIGGITQFGSDFSVNDISQNGYTTGRVAGIDISADGSIFSRYSNGQSLVLGQLALAQFQNVNGLQPLGDTAWGETFDSGNPVIGSPGTSSLGNIQSGSLEESNVELSQELVGLIIAQRNFQANARTIQTADTVTQAIINIR